ncbi:MAG: EAL domain-containing protein [Proteobacteria bacterium]|nr:EAL domain-containing protein [Pseudomonadota bacterium]
MNFLINGIFTLSYLATAVIVGFVVHRGGMVADPTAAIAIGVTVLLLGVLLHQGAARSRRDRVLVATISTMEQAQHRIEEQVASSRDDITILAAATEQAIRKAPQDDYDNIVAEVRTLETLVRQISDNPEGHEQPPFNLAVDAASAPVVPEDLDGERLLEIIRDALNNNRVDIYLQPVVSLPQRKPCYYETFSRLRDANGALIEPSKYIDAAESAGLITAIDNNLLFRCVQLVRKSQRRKLNFGFFCNISHFTLQDKSFFPEFIEFMQQNTALAENLIFEFAHSDLVNHDRYITSNLGQLGDLGFRFSVDRVEDLTLDVDELISRRISFVKVSAGTALNTLNNSEQALQFYRVKHALERAGIQLIVEKIEAEEQLVDLLDYGINYGQGYLFGSPRLSREI